MAGCGYVCPVCEGRGYDEEGNSCTYCTPSVKPKTITDSEWIESVHNNSCCSDIGKENKPD